MSTQTMTFRHTQLFIFAAGLLTASATQALSPPPPLPEDTLVAFYEAMNGDEWTNNDGWLDPDVPICDWYGITCVTEGMEFGGFEWIGYIRLADNNLQGQLSESLIRRLNGNSTVGVPSIELDLSGNAISGELPELPVGVPRLILANNQLEGPLPPQSLDHDGPMIGTPPPPPPLRLEYLDLSGNDFSEVIPEAWQEVLTLDHLDLSDNQLEGSIEAAVYSMNETGETGPGIRKTGLWLADNDFTGILDPAWFEDRDLNSINLCWTDVEIEDPALNDWIAERHLGGPQDACLGRERMALDATLSGSWYNPERSGEGFTLMMLDNGRPLIYWFSHIAGQRQMWQLSVGQPDVETLQFREMLRTRGDFESGLADIDQPVVRGGNWRLDRVGSDLLHGEQLIAYTGYDLYGGGLTWPPAPDTAIRQDFQRLTRLAGTSCNTRQPHQWISGAWSVPERSGQGFVVEVLEDGNGLVYWFTYTPAAQHNDSPVAASNDWQSWMIGQGTFDGQILSIDELLQPLDVEGTAPDDMTGVTRLTWGSLNLDFHDEHSGTASFESSTEDYESGSYPIERLARPMLADCPE